MSGEDVVAFAGDSLASKLARFFPNGSPLRIAVQVTDAALRSEHTTIEYGTAREILFGCTLPLEFSDKLRVQNADGSLDTEVYVVALRYEAGRTAVAARFTREPRHWIIKP